MQSEVESAILVPPIGEYDDHILGPKVAKASLLEYGDYQCPFCGAAYPIIKEIQRSLSKDLQFAFRNFPLASIHHYAEQAAEAAEAAGAQGKFWQMHDLLYENQARQDMDALLAYGAMIGLEMEVYSEALVSRKFREKVRKDFMTGIESGVNGTPTFFINGIRYNGPVEQGAMVSAIKQTLLY